MKCKQSVLGFVSGILTSVLLAGMILPVAAAGMSIWVDTQVKVFVDDAPLDAGDTHGNPEAFIYNGTTYVPVAAVSKSLGENVQWDGATRSVYIGKHGNEKKNLLEVCPPYQTWFYKTPDVISIAGTKYTKGFQIDGWYNNSGGYAYFNLNGDYDVFSFDVGHVDGTAMYPMGVSVILDDQVVTTLELKPDMMLEHYEIPLNGAHQMKIAVTESDAMAITYGFVNATLE